LVQTAPVAVLIKIVNGTKMRRDTLYFDGQCPLCSAEVAKLEKLATDKLLLRDIHSVQPGEALPDKIELLSTLHLQRANGDMLVGLEANIAAWQHTRWGVIFSWLSLPPFSWLGGRVYNLWAQRRYSRLYGNQ
jgi:predicted DCC family thiol-disulfide oxidoreductase YuxK